MQELSGFKLLDGDWDKELAIAVTRSPDRIRIICPFIKLRTARRIKAQSSNVLEVITRFDLNGFYKGVSDISALMYFLDSGAEVRGIKNLHSKLFIFSNDCAIAGSANLTEAAITRNHEFGFVTERLSIVKHCHEYFETLWTAAKRGISTADLERWLAKIESASQKANSTSVILPDYGEKYGGRQSSFAGQQSAAPRGEPLVQHFVKFFGRATDRAELSDTVEFHVRRSGCNWACTYPKGRRPRQVEDGARMFMCRMTAQPNDYRIFGKALGRSYRDGIDDATAAEIARRPWKADWPHYIRVWDGKFLNSNLAHGISLEEMMYELGPQSFLPTYRNYLLGEGNTDPRRSLMRKPHMQLTPQAAIWLEERLEQAFLRHGTLDLADPKFDQPKNPAIWTQ
ncbi:MAG: phospholipase D-like domain-containing protein [Parasphingopyxis sp.]|uniref:phospholipase D family protein n=1 Tax=Parasphingopyxis sp. TaxID=1920299 RepID=UPI003F9FA8D3